MRAVGGAAPWSAAAARGALRRRRLYCVAELLQIAPRLAAALIASSLARRGETLLPHFLTDKLLQWRFSLACGARCPSHRCRRVSSHALHRAPLPRPPCLQQLTPAAVPFATEAPRPLLVAAAAALRVPPSDNTRLPPQVPPLPPTARRTTPPTRSTSAPPRATSTATTSRPDKARSGWTRSGGLQRPRPTAAGPGVPSAHLRGALGPTGRSGCTRG